MPKQSRGFWVCSFCEQAFDRLEETTYHEESGECQRSSERQPPEHWNSFDISARSSTMAPLSNSEMSREATPVEAAAYPSTSQKRQRFLPLMGANDQSDLSESDTVACRSVELFEATDPLLFPGDSSAEPPSQRVTGRVGLRCSFCADTETAVNSYAFPGNTRSVGNTIRQVYYRHLSACSDCPEVVRSVIQEALQKQQPDQEGLRKLTEYCIAICRQVGIIDKHPENSGMVFGEPTGVYGTGGQAETGESVPQQRPIGIAPPLARDFGQRDVLSQKPQSEPGKQRGMPKEVPQEPFQPPFGPMMSYADPSVARVQLPPLPRMDDSMEPVAFTGPAMGYHQLQPYYLPPDFPFIQEQHGEWVCKFCRHLHPQLRDPQYFWLTPQRSPPPGEFVDYHLCNCREFQKSHYSVAYDYGPQAQPQYNSRAPATAAFSFDQSLLPGWEPAQASAGPRASPHEPEALKRDVASFPESHSQHVSHARAGKPLRRETPPQRQRQPQRRPEPIEGSDEAVRSAIEYLNATDKSHYDLDGSPIPEEDILVLEEDKLLLTDYFYHLMKQLRLVRFSEADRKTRGGKREKIMVGYGGLQCVHCAGLPNARKFFWSNVDRLANSFAEIPAHVLKCRRCPNPTKDALLRLKQRHPDQMARLPRGSQKIFFRRMWNRLHENDPPRPDDASSRTSATPSPRTPVPTRPAPLHVPHPSTQETKSTAPTEQTSPETSEGSIFLFERSTAEAARALADASTQAGPPSPSSRVLLAIPDDREWLSETDCFIRRQLEVFCATAEDVEAAVADRRYPVHEGQVGIRCIHCALASGGGDAKGQAVAYPYSISGIYESAREFQRLHLETCPNLPPEARAKLTALKGSASLSSVLRKYFVLAAKALGLRDTREGIRAGGVSVPLGSQAAFAFTEETEGLAEELKSAAEIPPAHFFAEDAERKRPATQDPSGSPDSKRSATSHGKREEI